MIALQKLFFIALVALTIHKDLPKTELKALEGTSEKKALKSYARAGVITIAGPALVMSHWKSKAE